MEKETKCMIAGYVGEAIIGSAIGVTVRQVVFPKLDNTSDKLTVALGSMIGTWMISRKWQKQWLKFCDNVFDTDFEEIHEEL